MTTRELGSRERSQPALPQIVWASLVDPRDPDARPWLELIDDEVDPHILASEKPDLVVWSSIWPDRPRDSIRFDIRTDDVGGGSLLRWTLLSEDDNDLSESRLGHMRLRMNVLINEKLRLSYGQ